ncbi:hypothetical protein QBC45DRAFT_485118 [Copromyces sp. CBS 386.78]|nr:hypothetical protein QBC45DRAFT_485118 [Copromyces sp. CBS 386.78]
MDDGLDEREWSCQVSQSKGVGTGKVNKATGTMVSRKIFGKLSAAIFVTGDYEGQKYPEAGAHLCCKQVVDGGFNGDMLLGGHSSAPQETPTTRREDSGQAVHDGDDLKILPPAIVLVTTTDSRTNRNCCFLHASEGYDASIHAMCHSPLGMPLDSRLQEDSARECRVQLAAWSRLQSVSWRLSSGYRDTVFTPAYCRRLKVFFPLRSRVLIFTLQKGLLPEHRTGHSWYSQSGIDFRSTIQPDTTLSCQEYLLELERESFHASA